MSLLLFTAGLLNAKVIATIPEASGICYIPTTKTLIVVNDEGWIYELTKKGKILRKKRVGNYDLEGVTYNPQSDTLYLAEEKKSSLLLLSYKNFKLQKELPIKRKFHGKKFLHKTDNSGIEGITFFQGELYLSHQSSFLFKIKLKKNRAKIVKIYNYGLKDIAGLGVKENSLFLVSDTKNLLIEYDVKSNRARQKIHLPHFAQEGICFDEKEYIFFADDDGRVLQYKLKKIGVK